MTDPKHSRAYIEQVLSDLEKRRPVFESLCKELSAHIEKCLRDEQIAFQAVQSRVKSAAKVEAKYLAPHKANRYDRLDDLTDIAALRIVTYYEDEVDVIKSIVEREFLIDWDNCQDKRIPENPELFTYSALHLVVSLKPETLGKERTNSSRDYALKFKSPPVSAMPGPRSSTSGTTYGMRFQLRPSADSRGSQH